ncbi:MAG: hypothetical protein QOG11_440 [Solirubrobacteraceae bacterium]|nr:hypothetical protein [Solirubrobacteraceae bacterium]
MRERPSPAMVVAVIALVVALGGTGYAASQLPPNSVGRKQLRDGAVGATKIRTNAVGATQIRADAVRSKQVQDGSLTAKDLAPGVVPKSAGQVRQASGDPVPAGAVGAASVACNPGERLMGGGGGFAGPPLTNDKLVDSIPVGFDQPPGRWRVSLFNGGTAPRTPVAYVICETP